MKAFRLAVLLAVAAPFLMPQTAVAGSSASVSIQDFRFTPRDLQATESTDVGWTNRGPFLHSTTSDFGLWDSGLLQISPAAGSSFGKAFYWAGTLGYHCSRHPSMKGSVILRVGAPSTAARNVAFGVSWAGSLIPDGFAEDVQIKRPGRRGFFNWRVGNTGAQTNAQYTPTRRGKYSFRARMRNLDTGAASGYSPVAIVDVT